MTEQMKLVNELRSLGNGLPLTPVQIADFILADRKRICEPLIEQMNRFYNPNPNIPVDFYGATKETLKLAGL